jgi:endonuclease/exonuclease/phosphatase family metal-dependent hydrolase
MRVLSWNLYHGRDFPPDKALFTLRSRLLRATERNATHVQVNRLLLDELAGVLDGFDWDVALLQEAPPRWFGELERRTGAGGARVFTSRNLLPPLQGLLADWNPDLIASWEGGSNQILARSPMRILEERRLTLTRRPERRRMHWTRLEHPEMGRMCVSNIHATAGHPRQASAEVVAAAEAAAQWSGGDPLVFGGDLNLRPASDAEVFDLLRDRFGMREPTAPDAIDHVLARGLQIVAQPRLLAPEERELTEPDGLLLRLSDHRPVLAGFVR